MIYFVKFNPNSDQVRMVYRTAKSMRHQLEFWRDRHGDGVELVATIPGTSDKLRLLRERLAYAHIRESWYLIGPEVIHLMDLGWLPPKAAVDPRPVFSAAGSPELVAWLDRLARFGGYPGREELLLDVLRCHAQDEHFPEPMPER